MSKKTLVLGASNNPERYAYKAITQLTAKGHPVIAVGKKKGQVAGVEIQENFPEADGSIDTVTLYLNSENQKPFYQKIINLKPKRVVFNPGAENIELEKLVKENGIEPVEACTLVMLSIGNY